MRMLPDAYSTQRCEMQRLPSTLSISLRSVCLLYLLPFLHETHDLGLNILKKYTSPQVNAERTAINSSPLPGLSQRKSINPTNKHL